MPDPDIEKLKAALELLRPIGGTKNETQAIVALEAMNALDRLAARVVAVWCFDMEKAPKDKDLQIAIDNRMAHEGRWLTATDTGPDPGWYWAGYGRSPVGPLVATAWRPLPPPPETADGR